MKLLITTEAVSGYDVGDILAVVPDTHLFGNYETLAAWVASGRAPEDFPNSNLAVVELPLEPPDLNLAEPELEQDPFEAGGSRQTLKRGWRFDLDRLPRPVRAQLEAPGAVVAFPRARRDVVRRKVDDLQLPLRAENDGNTTGRHPASSARRF